MKSHELHNPYSRKHVFDFEGKQNVQENILNIIFPERVKNDLLS